MAIKLNTFEGSENTETWLKYFLPVEKCEEKDYLIVLYVCPNCGKEMYACWTRANAIRSNLADDKLRNWKKLDDPKMRDHYEIMSDSTYNKAIDELKLDDNDETVLIENILQDFVKIINNDICPCCGHNLSFEPGYFLLFIEDFADDFEFDDSHKTNLRLEIKNKIFTFEYYAKLECYTLVTINYDKSDIVSSWKAKYGYGSAYSDNQTYQNNFLVYEFGEKLKAHKESIDGSFSKAKNYSPEITILFNARNIDEKELIDKRYRFSIDEAFDLLKYYRKSIKEPEQKQLVEGIIKKYANPNENYDIKIENGPEFLKKYLSKLIGLETDIYSLSKRIPDIAFASEEAKRLIQGKQSFFKDEAKIKELKEKLAELEKTTIEEVKYESVLNKLLKNDFIIKQLPKVPEKPAEPYYETPGFFNKKKINAQNAQKKAEYEKQLSEWNALMIEYEDKKKQIEAENAEIKAKAEEEAKRIADKENEKLTDELENKKLAVKSELTKAEEALEEKKKSLSAEKANDFEVEYNESIELLKSLLEARNKLLSANVVYEKYRNIVAYSTFYEYLMAGRCETLEGTNGAYNIYENEIRANIIISQLSNVLESLEQIKENQFKLYQQLEYVNNSLDMLNDSMNKALASIESIDTSVKHIADNSDVIAYNTERTAYYSKMNAELTDALGFMVALK